MASVANADQLDAVTCSVCKDVFKNPVKISCNHSIFCPLAILDSGTIKSSTRPWSVLLATSKTANVLETSFKKLNGFCEDCINQTWAANGHQTCPVCRTAVDGRKQTDFDMIQKMSRQSINCSRCQKRVILTEYRRHERTCGSGATRFTGPSTSLGLGESSRPNIYTFPCPYCTTKNLDREGLLRHVLAMHKDGDPKVVCPICKVMPWGNHQQISGNFLDHIKLRHRFDYDRFVDFNQDEETALKNALALSVEEN